jgi:hypothetical protein
MLWQAPEAGISRAAVRFPLPFGERDWIGVDGDIGRDLKLDWQALLFAPLYLWERGWGEGAER